MHAALASKKHAPTRGGIPSLRPSRELEVWDVAPDTSSQV